MTKSRFGLIILVLGTVAVSCNKDFKDLSADSSLTANNEVLSESYSIDVEDLSAVAVLSDPNAGGRAESGLMDDRFGCATITRTTGTEPFTGTITVDFGDAGCKDRKDNTRKGKMVISYKGKRNLPGSTCVTRLVNYSLNDVKIEGTRTISSDASSTDNKPVFKVKLDSGKTTWPDGTFATHEFLHVRTWFRTSNASEDSWQVLGSGRGVSRRGTNYEMWIRQSTPLLYKKSCESVGVFIAVSGVKVVKKDGKEITIDYGNGVCNNLVTVTFNGVSKVIEISKKGG
ncbi:MAG: hypothetical protein ACKOC0_12715 [Cytophagales bacterium]